MGDEIVPLLQLHDIHNDNFRTFPRLRIGDSTYYCMRYQNAKTRNDCVVSFLQEDNNISYGSVIVFLESGNLKYAILQKYEVEAFTLENEMKNAITMPNLRKYLDKPLCPHIVKKTGCIGKIVLPIQSLRKKCVMIELDKDHLYISCPPNLLEHN